MFMCGRYTCALCNTNSDGYLTKRISIISGKGIWEREGCAPLPVHLWPGIKVCACLCQSHQSEPLPPASSGLTAKTIFIRGRHLFSWLNMNRLVCLVVFLFSLGKFPSFFNVQTKNIGRLHCLWLRTGHKHLTHCRGVAQQLSGRITSWPA